jgi:hypothetical protein
MDLTRLIKIDWIKIDFNNSKHITQYNLNPTNKQT